jgi:cell division protein FtsB
MQRNTGKMQEGLKEKIARAFAIAVLLAVFVTGLIFVRPEYRRSQSLKERDAELALQIEEKRRQIAELMECQRKFKTDRDFVESIARRNKRVYPGELVFEFED